MLELFGQIEEAVAAIQSQWDKKPHAGIILGTGLGSLVEEIDVELSLDYGDIPNCHQSPRSVGLWPAGWLASGRHGRPFSHVRGIPSQANHAASPCF